RRGSAEVAYLLDPGAAEGLASRVLDGGPVDVLVNAAGVFERDAGGQTTQESWDRVLFLNTTVTFVLCQAIGRQMIERGGGKIVNFASTDGMVGVPEQSAYCASKGAVVQLTRTLGAEWIKHGVNVNAVGPCDFDTPMIAEALGEPEYRAWILDAIPAGRVGKPDEIVGAVLYLASPASDMVVGHTLMVDGGRTAIRRAAGRRGPHCHLRRRSRSACPARWVASAAVWSRAWTRPTASRCTRPSPV